MDQERWRKLADLYHTARARGRTERPAFLSDACGGDEELRSQIEELLARDPSTESTPAEIDSGLTVLLDEPPRIQLGPGARLGPYRIDATLGVGGMGQVFRGEDTRLSRPVAIKVLLSSRDQGPSGAERFLQEARAASALNHPNIVTIYDVGSVDDLLYIVMELVEGETLRKTLAGGPLPPRRLLELAGQIADALATAHARGIVHRDLKPANIMITPDGRAKILDFGLAKRFALGAAAGGPDRTHDPLTLPGTVLGTYGYMSPEQARGENLDFRSDQFSFGAVLYEMGAGRRAFHAASEVDALAAVIRDQPEPITRLNPQIPMPFQWAVERCLSKNPHERYGSTRELANELAALAVAGSPVGAEPARTPHNLPSQRTALVGRELELAGAKQLTLQTHVRLVTLTGPGGIGKTRLMIELGRQLLPDFTGGVYFVPLDRISDPQLVPSEIANALSVLPVPDRSVTSLLKETIRQFGSRRTLLMLDNFEHVLEAAQVATELLSASDSLKIVVASRAAMRVYGEYEFPVPSLAVADAATASAEALARSPAVALFLERSTALRPGASTAGSGKPIDEEQIRMVAEICTRLDGLPLAIELAAARTKVLPLGALLERVRDPLQLLAGGPRDLPLRQRTLRATLDWSHNLLHAEQQKVFRRLSVFVGGATHEAIEAVCNAKEDLNSDILDTVESLVDNSLLRRTGSDLTEPRFVMLETMREYGLARLAEAGEEAYTRKAHAAYFLVLAEESQTMQSGPERPAWNARFDAEIGNLRSALDWLQASGEAEWGIRFVMGLGLYWQDRGLANEGYDRLTRLLSLPKASPRNKLRGWALSWAGDLAYATKHRYESSHEHYYAEALGIFEELQDTAGALRAFTAAGALHRDRGDYPRAQANFERVVELARGMGDPSALAGALSNLADFAKTQREFELARLLNIESARLFEQVGDHLALAWSLSHQADLLLEQGQTETARDLYEQAMAKFRSLENRMGVAACYYDLACIAADKDDYATARRLCRESLRIYWDLGHKPSLPRVIEGLACCAAANSEPELALTLAGIAAVLRELITEPRRESAKAKLEQSLEMARQQLTGPEAAASWMRGSTMPLENAVRLAIGD